MNQDFSIKLYPKNIFFLYKKINLINKVKNKFIILLIKMNFVRIK